MPKKYTTDPNSGFFNEDDMPCRCDCGNWFDLNDGYSTCDSKVVCEECHDNEQRLIREEEAKMDDDFDAVDGEEEEDDDDIDTSSSSDLYD